jgi:hypothetical protein
MSLGQSINTAPSTADSASSFAVAASGDDYQASSRRHNENWGLQGLGHLRGFFVRLGNRKNHQLRDKRRRSYHTWTKV